jgi:hypothetical protein
MRSNDHGILATSAVCLSPGVVSNAIGNGAYCSSGPITRVNTSVDMAEEIFDAVPELCLERDVWLTVNIVQSPSFAESYDEFLSKWRPSLYGSTKKLWFWQ